MSCNTSTTAQRVSWRPPRRFPTGLPIMARSTPPKCTPPAGEASKEALAAPTGVPPKYLALAINLDRRADRLAAMGLLGWSLPWQRLPAVDGRALSWASLSSDVHAEAIREAEWAEEKQMPTICRSPEASVPAAGSLNTRAHVLRTVGPYRLAASPLDQAEANLLALDPHTIDRLF